MEITYTTRRSQIVTQDYTTEQAIERLAYLDADEANTRRLAPTDSGDVRFNYQAEAAAIRAALAGLGSARIEITAPPAYTLKYRINGSLFRFRADRETAYQRAAILLSNGVTPVTIKPATGRAIDLTRENYATTKAAQ